MEFELPAACRKRSNFLSTNDSENLLSRDKTFTCQSSGNLIPENVGHHSFEEELALQFHAFIRRLYKT